MLILLYYQFHYGWYFRVVVLALAFSFQNLIGQEDSSKVERFQFELTLGGYLTGNRLINKDPSLNYIHQLKKEIETVDFGENLGLTFIGKLNENWGVRFGLNFKQFGFRSKSKDIQRYSLEELYGSNVNQNSTYPDVLAYTLLTPKQNETTNPDPLFGNIYDAQPNDYRYIFAVAGDVEELNNAYLKYQISAFTLPIGLEYTREIHDNFSFFSALDLGFSYISKVTSNIYANGSIVKDYTKKSNGVFSSTNEAYNLNMNFQTGITYQRGLWVYSCTLNYWQQLSQDTFLNTGPGYNADDYLEIPYSYGLNLGLRYRL